ncbi:hypothetical protein [Pedobacter puniceum]|uniref:Uncharacterized protein n=1 Tax=Pedobacter puniceum TaxID=2666136 RepID=A0A7K0FNB0_9SPHI|nr:hypothetical protein [Pedobacter puniceum]MRX47469.1 hypothetical protein [Pedobacter puniceum]
MFKKREVAILKSQGSKLLSFNMKLFLFFLALLISLQLKKTSANDKYDAAFPHLNIISSGSCVKQYHHHLPSESFPKPYQEEASDDNEPLEYDDDSLILNWNITAGSSLQICSSVKRLLTQLLQSYQNQPQVALFILHHSWKSYLIA